MEAPLCKERSNIILSLKKAELGELKVLTMRTENWII